MSRRSLMRGLALVEPTVRRRPIPRFLARPSTRITPVPQSCRFLSTTSTRQSPEIRSIAELPNRIIPRYLRGTKPGSSLLTLNWPKPPRNLLIIHKLYSDEVVDAVVKFSKYIHNEYPEVHLVFEPRIAQSLKDRLDFPIHTSDSRSNMADKIDVIATFGGDGTVLRAASLYKLHGSVPPILSFNMGTLGFLGEWDFREYKKAWRETFMSGSDVAMGEANYPRGEWDKTSPVSYTAWERHRGKSMGAQRASKVLLRHRIKADVFDPSGKNINHWLSDTLSSEAKTGAKALAVPHEPSPSLRAINEISVHRGSHPHLARIDIYQNGHFLTETTADGILISTPTGSTAYSLSAGGPIVHPLVKSLLITPISPCSLSFRSLVLPLDTKVTLRMSPKNRGRELDLSIDGKRCAGVLPGTEIRVEGEFVGRAGPGEEWHGGVPCMIRTEDDDPWVGGLTGLLKFNHPFGREPAGDEYAD
ncbi:NAD+ kinase [Fusarium austroafricanum]|uniref:NAD+ kinase n=1 Tax=Fusarium austroafricanum TaxID=2364996 RepID=A0A8H4KJ73_9HYPO|nr:NAD+ kinase [Fusarium austroafricanum]